MLPKRQVIGKSRRSEEYILTVVDQPKRQENAIPQEYHTSDSDALLGVADATNFCAHKLHNEYNVINN